eukprot:CAMPEP_0184480906 /NCGR_PEP_ID=MMETSP0113_2-20130426/2427_1 /TAXON_ID=91329 /ORGANISM="Norrisiella sphaerica, Strain BC52" /LENGTH=371 /DNA_ID=CAMNT_0026859701 /DNA_START=617 /DNA_END=1732 /DNA_ORIENTATION=+
MAFGAVTSFSMLSAVRLFQPHSVGSALRRTWTLSVPFFVKVFLSMLLLALIPVSVVVVFAKLSQLEQVLVLHLDQWHIFPEYLIFLGFLNQLLGITDNIQSETSTVLDLLFLGQDAQLSAEEGLQREFILHTIYLEAVGKWGWSGIIFMANLGSSGWQRLFVVEDDAPSAMGERSTLLADRFASQSRYRYDTLRRLPGGNLKRDDNNERKKNSGSAMEPKKRMVSFINTESGSRTRDQAIQIMIVNDYNKELRGVLQELRGDGREGGCCYQGCACSMQPDELRAERSWEVAPDQVKVIRKNVMAGWPYRLVINVGRLGGGRDNGYVVLPFTTPIHGDVQVHLRAILNAKEIHFGAIDSETVICGLFGSANS